jgi:outer membrane receptor protein involved in Fe transport
MGGGYAALALGIQYRENKLSQDYDELSNQDSFTFVIGNPDLDGSQDVWAAFGELALPINDELDVQVAVRYEDYGGNIGSTVDPKLAVSWRASDEFSLRGSISTSFRAPTVFLAQGGATSLQQVVDPVQGAQAFVAVRTEGNEDLKPEESTAYNIGFSYEPFRDLSIEVDYWNFEFEDLIIQENAQALLNADPTDTDRIVRAGDPVSGPVLQINNTYVNASSLETSGIDFVTSYKMETELGNFTPSIHATYITKYDLMDPQAGNVDGAGRRNFNNIGVSSPELRMNIGLAWQHDVHAANLFVRYISSYDDDQNCADGTSNTGGCANGFYEIDSIVTVDAQYNIDLGSVFNTEQSYVLTVGGINLFDEEPPQVFTNSGFDSKVHDPRGRQIYARLAVEF